MNSASDSPLRRRPRRWRTFFVLVVALVVALAGYAAYATYVTSGPPGETTLVVYTYESLFGGSCGAPAFSTVFGTFATQHHVHFEIECPSGTLSSTLIAEAHAPRADLVIGLDEITTPQAEAAGVLVPYAPPGLVNVNASLVAELSPDRAAVPYESGYLAIDYSAPFAKATDDAVANSSFNDFADNTSWSNALYIEDPTTDITGEEFLLWEIAYSQAVEHTDWTGFWQAADPHLQVAPDWGTAFSEFNASTGSISAVASYSADPAYAAYYGVSGTFNATVSHSNGTAYGWRSVYGIGIVHGTAHLALDEEFENWFLNGTVQSEIPTNEWEYPANSTVPLPSAYAAAIDPATVVPLNAAIPPSEIVTDLPGWLNEWQSLENEYG